MLQRKVQTNNNYFPKDFFKNQTQVVKGQNLPKVLVKNASTPFLKKIASRSELQSEMREQTISRIKINLVGIEDSVQTYQQNSSIDQRRHLRLQSALEKTLGKQVIAQLKKKHQTSQTARYQTDNLKNTKEKARKSGLHHKFNFFNQIEQKNQTFHQYPSALSARNTSSKLIPASNQRKSKIQ